MNDIRQDSMDTSSSPRGNSNMTVGSKANWALINEFKKWSGEGEKQIRRINLRQETQDPEDGKTSLTFLHEAGQQEFIVHCPIHYPEYNVEEDNFFVEADSGLQLWCNALNEFVLDTDSRLTLTAILNKGLSLYSSADEAAATNSNSGNHKMIHSDTGNGQDADEHDDAGSSCSGDEMDVNYEDEEDPVQCDDEQLEDILDSDLSWELEIARRKKRWRIKENELRAERSRACDSGIVEEDKTLQQLYHDPCIKNRQPKQVFTSAAASGILTNDLVQIMETSESTGIAADTIDDNIFQWNVKMSQFDKDCFLNKDFEEMMKDHGYNYLELQLDFSMDLYPFFPPLVKVIRPRLQGSMMLRVTTMEILKLSYWNPAKDMKSVLEEIKSFLQTWARLDLLSARNDRTRYLEGAYIDIEHHLLRLALVSEMVPRANKKYVAEKPQKASLPPTAMESAGAINKEKKKLDEKKTPKSKFGFFAIIKDSKDDKKKSGVAAKNMAKGTGYSSYQQKGWDVKAYMAAQKEKDKQIELVLEKINQELKKLHGSQKVVGQKIASDTSDEPVSSLNCNSNDLTTVEVESRIGSKGGSTRKRKHSPDDLKAAGAVGVNEENGAECDPIDPQSDLYTVLEGSVLIPFLESKLQANSFLEICRHPNVYKCVVNIVREISNQPCLVSLLGPLSDQPFSIQVLLSSLEAQAEILLDKIGKAAANGSVPKSGKTAEKVAEKSSDDKLAREFLKLSKDVYCALKLGGYLLDTNGQTATDTNVNNVNTSTVNKEEEDPSDPVPGPSGMNQDGVRRSREEKAADLYEKYMKSLLFDSVDFTVTGSNPSCHHFASHYNKSGNPSSQVIIRVAQEVSSLSTSLPLDFSSTIYVRSDDDKVTLLKAIITGPEGTPYTGGCYQFDIFFPIKYPHVAPQVSFRTTGGGLVRFNPNLYSCGKVCLSLLGTWEGAQGEQWNETSTILQVLISIQSLILCAEPYYNEPGFERLYGTSQGDSESLRYSEEVFKNNLKYAILGQLQNPPEGFEDVVRAHFFLKRNILLEELEKMLEKYKSKEVKRQFQDVKRELMKLEQPPNLKKTFQST